MPTEKPQAASLAKGNRLLSPGVSPARDGVSIVCKHSFVPCVGYFFFVSGYHTRRRRLSGRFPGHTPHRSVVLCPKSTKHGPYLQGFGGFCSFLGVSTWELICYDSFVQCPRAAGTASWGGYYTCRGRCVLLCCASSQQSTSCKTSQYRSIFLLQMQCGS